MEPDHQLEARISGCWDLPGVGAGSGLLRIGRELIAIQDDAPAAARIDPITRRVAMIPLAEDVGRLAKAMKPDFEAIAADAAGTLWVFGSGSAQRRRRIARLQEDPAEGWVVEWFDASPLYDAIAAAIGEVPNLEGAAVYGDGLRLFHRGAGRTTCRNWVVDVGLGPRGPEPPVRAAWGVELGRLGEVPLSFTDAAPLGDGRFLYLAAAEDTPDAIADGPVVGAAIGVLTGGADGPRVRWTPLLEADGRPSVRKAEGLAPDSDLGGAWLITDPDDAERPAQLCRVTLTGDWA